MIDRAWAEHYARDWAANWRAKNLDGLLEHYSPAIVFSSPRIGLVLGNNQASVIGTSEQPMRNQFKAWSQYMNGGAH